MTVLLLLHVAATLTMTGLIWFVQVVHYPLFDAADRVSFASFESRHKRRTTWVVAPLMLTEAATGVVLALAPPRPEWAPWLWAGLFAIALIWAATAGLQVPMHSRLSRGFDAPAHARLTLTNWLRTALWSMRSALVLALLGDALAG